MASIKQSFSWWCFAQLVPAPQLMRAAAEIGFLGVELVPQEHWQMLKDHGLAIISIDGHSSIQEGLNRREHHPRIEQEIRAKLALAQEWGIRNLIVFSGNRAGLDDQSGLENTAEGLSRVAKAAEDAGVMLVMELLNSKVDHQDYQGDHVSWGLEVCRRVNSPAVRLLYDIYHMQIMEGDIIRTIQENHAYFAHYHTAGNPGRHELDENQELYYPPIVHAIKQTGYQGYIGHEFSPLGEPLGALRHAFVLCQV
jgi:hydroxypyruvate isomerase